MEKLERYLDQVCRSMGGPRSLRQHVRQELREHLLDAVAQHKAAGASDEAALESALEEFGKPDDVRSELESAHGQRMMAVVIEKAMQWKEMTMKAKWLWMSWAYAALGLVVALEVFFITFAVIFIVPKYLYLMQSGLIDPAIVTEAGVSWMPAFLIWLAGPVGNNATWLVIASAALWGLFEWRVRSENKPLMRLSAFGTVAVGLMVVVILTGGSLVISFCLGVPATGRVVRPFARDQVSQIDAAVAALDRLTTAKEWAGMAPQTDKIAEALDNLTKLSPVIPALAARNNSPTAEELRVLATAMSEDLLKAQRAIREQDAGGMDTSLRNFRKSFEPMNEAAKRMVR